MFLRQLIAALASMALALAASLQASAQSPLHPRPETRIGPNVIVIPDRAARSVTGWLVVLAGCADEAGGQCLGIAHYLEHLLFINRDNEHRSKVAFFPDGAGNGWTTHRATTYFQRFPSKPETNESNLDKLVGYFAGLLSEVRVSGEQADRERNVVLQEYQQNTGRNPLARFAVKLNLALLPGDPLGQRVIGSPAAIRAFQPDAARAFHDRWYTRDNAVLVLHGPVTADGVRPLVEKHLSVLPRRDVPAHAWKDSRTYPVGRQVLRTTEKDAGQASVSLDRIVTFDESEAQAAEHDAAALVLSAFLGSRLKDSPGEQLIDRDGLFTDARLSFGRVRRGAWRISFSGVPVTGSDPEEAAKAVRGYIADLPRRGLSQELVDRLKMRIRNERALLAQQPALYAQALVNWLAAHNSYEAWSMRDTRHQAVTATGVERLLALTAGPGREVVGVMLPGSPIAEGGPTPNHPGGMASPAETLPQ